MSKGDNLMWSWQVCCPRFSRSYQWILVLVQAGLSSILGVPALHFANPGFLICACRTMSSPSPAPGSECKESAWADSTARQLKGEAGKQGPGERGGESAHPAHVSRDLDRWLVWEKPTRDQGSFSQKKKTPKIILFPLQI